MATTLAPLLRTAKQFTFRAAEASGLNRVIGSSEVRRQRLLILCYHGVSLADEHEWDPELYVSADHLRRRLALLRKTRCTVLPLGEALERCATDTLPSRAVALTFDDGTADFALRAVPILREFDAPATVYLTTYYCGRPLPVPNVALSYLQWKARRRGMQVGAETETALDAASADEKDSLIRRTAESCGVDYDAFIRSRLLQIMNPEEVKALPSDLISVELHTHRHRMPSDPDLLAREISENRERILELCGRYPTHLCYPSGFYRPEMLSLLRKQRVRSATTCIPGYVTSATDPLMAPRFADTSLTPDTVLRGWLSGFAALVPRRAPAAL